MTYALRTFDPAEDANINQLALRQCRSPTTKKGTKRIPAIRLRTIFRHRDNFATRYFRLLCSSPHSGSGTFLPGGRPPVNVLCKGGRSPNSERARNTLLVALRDSQLDVPKTGLALPSRKTYCMGEFRHERTNHYMSTLQG
jgi:hypothetical protein